MGEGGEGSSFHKVDDLMKRNLGKKRFNLSFGREIRRGADVVRFFFYSFIYFFLERLWWLHFRWRLIDFSVNFDIRESCDQKQILTFICG